MSKQIFLLENIKRWKDEAMIGDSLASRLKEDVIEQYPKKSLNASVIFATFGALLFGLGIVLLFAYNWDAIGKYYKLTALFTSIILFHYLGYFFSLRNSSTWLLELFRLLGTLCFGAGIALVAQIYHLDEHAPNGILLFAAGTACAAYAYRSISHGVIMAIAIIVWQFTEFTTDGRYYENSIASITPLIMIVFMGGLVYYLRSKLLLIVGLIGFVAAFIISLCFNQISNTFLLQIYIFIMGIFMYAMSTLLGTLDLSKWFWLPFRILGHAVFIPFLFLWSTTETLEKILKMHTFEITLNIDSISMIIYLTFFIFVAIFTATRLRKISLFDWIENLWIPFVTALIYFGSKFLCKKFMPYTEGMDIVVVQLTFIANIIIGYLAVSRIFRGCIHHQLGGTILGVLLLSGLIVLRFMTLFDSLIARGISFLIVGGIMVTVAIIYSKYSKKRERLI